MAAGGANTDSLVKRSEYLTKLSSEARKRFVSKVVIAGLNIDPVIDKWSEIRNYGSQWSDVVLYMVSTPSPYTKESIKVG